MKEAQVTESPSTIVPPTATILAMGEHHIATSVEYANLAVRRPRFDGKMVRSIRRHYAWLCRRLGERKLLNVIRRVGSREMRKVNAILHNISRDIVNRAKEANAVIVLGDLKGIRRRAKGKRLNRIV